MSYIIIKTIILNGSIMSMLDKICNYLDHLHQSKDKKEIAHSTFTIFLISEALYVRLHQSNQ